MVSRTVVLLLAALVVAAGCGESKSDKAMADVCAARDDISKQVDQLKGLTIGTATTSQISDGLAAIRNDLSNIADARGNLADEKREQVEAANKAFTASLRDTLSNLGTTVSLEEAATQLKQSLQQLEASYKTTFGELDCS